MITKEQLHNISQKTGVNENAIIREYIQVVFLKELYQKKASQEIYFKGGTAIHLLFPAPRFSMDLDFTTGLPKNTLLETTQNVVKSVRPEIPNLEFKISPKEKKESLTGTLYWTKEGRKYPLTVDLEYSLREKPIQKPIKTLLKTDLPVVGSPLVLHLTWQEILAEKIRAVLTRKKTKGRDFYDIYYLLYKGTPLKWELVKEKMKLYPDFEEDINKETVIKQVGTFDEKKLKQDLGAFLHKSEKENLLPRLKNELVNLLKHT